MSIYHNESGCFLSKRLHFRYFGFTLTVRLCRLSILFTVTWFAFILSPRRCFIILSRMRGVQLVLIIHSLSPLDILFGCSLVLLVLFPTNKFILMIPHCPPHERSRRDVVFSYIFYVDFLFIR